MGLIAMSERDLQRIEVLSKVVHGWTTLVSAAHVLGLSTRQVRRLLDRIRTSDAASMLSRFRGQIRLHRHTGRSGVAMGCEISASKLTRDLVGAN
ncbi:hypothetical protein BA011_38940 (plasmid) [Rhizobium leguminosarum]|uniref:Uncharacterized protein n=1 Tax=Rhizobium leguminosarum TaxID=384 RepID=A0A1B1CQ03_RHILE|nr:hypothetical protein BA011_38940 [Rhizobium leguminosarum]